MDFIKGMDVSMIKELEQHGARYYIKGVEKDFFTILKECGVNLVRLRLWNHPYDEFGNSYGGGTNDLATTIELAKRVKNNGIRFMLDFHYSDFWADPAKQIKPKAWKNFSGTKLRETVKQYTLDILYQFKKEGVLPEIVQVGNEITNGLLWPDGHVNNLAEMAQLLKAGIDGVKAVDAEIKVMLHLDFGTDNAMYRKWFSDIAPFGLDFDMIGMSYYPYWNGSIDKLLYNMNDISQTFQKDVLVAETAIGYTVDPLGCNGVVYSQEQAENTDYEPSLEGQSQFLADLYRGVREIQDHRGVGVLYWEPEWLPIPECAWANPNGCRYMNDKAEIGNSWANQALFDEKGNANQALLNFSKM
jgi:arabinogalactan endo-1,4-beta-galactosidase